MFKPTQQQKDVIEFVDGHARVLAVAGSGKTTTMVHRIINLIGNHKVNADQIWVLMYNAAARKDFTKKYKKETDLPIPEINTFHSFAYRIITLAIKKKYLPPMNFWILDEEINMDITIRNIIRNLENAQEIEENQLDLEEAKNAISWWKNSLISPENAGHHLDEMFVTVYKRFEDIRAEENAITFDDFVPYAIKLINKHVDIQADFINKAKHIIIDEYQDVNEAQQQVLQLIAGSKANVMAVGDDDQTIYEWRGARPEFILDEFGDNFPNKNNTIFKLNETFRFGPILSQCAQNSIQFNKIRHSKKLLAGDTYNTTSIVVKNNSSEAINYNHYFTEEIKRMVMREDVKPSSIRVIGRMYTQFLNLEISFLTGKIPYLIEGSEAFFKKREIKLLLSYIVIIEKLHEKLDENLINKVMFTVNTPNRMVNKTGIKIKLEESKNKDLSVYEALEYVARESEKDNNEVKDSLVKMIATFSKLNLYFSTSSKSHVNKEESFKISTMLQILVEDVDLYEYYLKLYGDNERSDTKIRLVSGFIAAIKENLLFKEYLTPSEFEKVILAMDTTRGASEHQIIYFSTIFKTKGLEFDYIFIPSCNDGMMPYTKFADTSSFDNRNKKGGISTSLEGERRLFYVAITRARKKVYIGTDSGEKIYPSRFIEEIQWKKTTNVFHNLVHKLSFNEKWKEMVLGLTTKNKMLESLTYYLKKENKIEELTLVADLMNLGEEEKFAYQYDYDTKDDNKELKIENKRNPWEDVIL